MGQVLLSAERREVVTCGNASCSCVQYRHRNGLCVRCHKSLSPPEVKAVAVLQPVVPRVALVRKRLDLTKRLKAAIKQVRLRKGFSQAQLAQKAGEWPRTYISKIENGHCTPRISTLEKIAAATEVNVSEIIRLAERPDAQPSENFRVIHGSVGDRISEAIRVRQRKLGFDDRELRRRTALPHAYFWRVMTGKQVPMFQTLQKFAAALKTTVHRIIADAEKMACKAAQAVTL